MLLHPLTYTREAASCPTFLGWTAEAVGGAADGISGGRDGMIFTPPRFVNLFLQPCCREAAVRLRRAHLLRSAVSLRSRRCVCIRVTGGGHSRAELAYP